MAACHRVNNFVCAKGSNYVCTHVASEKTQTSAAVFKLKYTEVTESCFDLYERK